MGFDVAEEIGVAHDAMGHHEVVSRIPSAFDRPCFRCFDEPYQDPNGEGFTEGVWYFTSKSSREGQPVLGHSWISSPIKVTAITSDATGHSYGRRLSIKTSKGWREMMLPMDLLAGDGKEMRAMLLRAGASFDVSNASRAQFMRYLQFERPKTELQAVTQVGWANDACTTFALPNESLGVRSASVSYQGDLCTDFDGSKGTVDGWRDSVARLARGNPLMMAAISAAFAGPVLRLTGTDNGGLHFYGDSSTGKSTICFAAGSVWGHPEEFKTSWRATANGLEGIATKRSDNLLILDEIGECKAKDVDAATYFLVNGMGKTRATQTGAARPAARWRTFILSSGEHSLATMLKKGEIEAKAGQLVRIPNVPCQRNHGAFDRLHECRSSFELAARIKTAYLSHHGEVGRAFLNQLTRRDKGLDLIGRLEEIRLAVMDGVSTDGNGQCGRAAIRFAVAALGGELATEYGLTGWDKGEATEAARVAFAEWMADRGGIDGGSIEQNQVVERVADFIAKHGDARFSSTSEPECGNGRRIQNRAGWWQRADEHSPRDFLFSPVGLAEAISGGDLRSALKQLAAAGVLMRPASKGFIHRQRIYGDLHDFYRIRFPSSPNEA